MTIIAFSDILCGAIIVPRSSSSVAPYARSNERIKKFHPGEISFPPRGEAGSNWLFFENIMNSSADNLGR